MQSLQFPYQTAIYHGKVRDVYTIGTDWLIMIASDRISAFDVILPKTIPYKGQVLNQIAEFMLGQTKDICPNWLLDAPAPNVSVGKKCTPFKIEMVVRGNLVGHAYRTYASGARTLCGVSLPEGLKENDFFPSPIITPSTKASEGHDEDISKDEIINNYDLLVFGPEQDKLEYKLSACCNPIVGDDVYGFLTINEGIKVHKKDCPNSLSMQSNYAYRVIKAKWIDSTQQEFKAVLIITGMDFLGLTNELTKVISSNMNINIQN